MNPTILNYGRATILFYGFRIEKKRQSPKNSASQGFVPIKKSVYKSGYDAVALALSFCGRQVPRPALAGYAGPRGTIRMKFPWLTFCSPLRAREAPPYGRGASHLSLVAKTTLCLLGYLTKRDAQCVGYPFAICRVGLQTVSYMPQFDLPGGITHCTSGVGK